MDYTCSTTRPWKLLCRASRIDKTGSPSDERRFVVHDLLLDKLDDNVSPWLLVASLTIAQRSLHDSAGQRCVRSDDMCGAWRGIIAESTILRTMPALPLVVVNANDIESPQ